ncbi:hypothetical protein [Corynebacterium sp. NML130628]|uniref:hypothetical protein n=1 Tax=Corynebacterium sp. NML130628 TaxID=1906333 RepID=UPI0011607F24|nr:hypothetical protein [Corynebacterium sp. NML130628]
MRLKQIEGVRLALRLFDRQLEASAKATANGTPQQRAFDTSCQKFLESLSSLRSGDRLEQIRGKVEKTVQEKAQPSGDQPAEKPDGDSSATLTPYDRAQLLVDKEAVEARTKYENDRTVLLDKPKQIQEGELPAEEEPEASGAVGSSSLSGQDDPTAGVKRRQNFENGDPRRTNPPRLRNLRKQSVNAPQEIRDAAARWASSKAGTGYNSPGAGYRYNFAFNKNINGNSFNCSSLVWSAYMYASQNEIDLDKNGGPGVYPDDVRDSPFVEDYE